jgi:hypothetical protein
MWNRKKKPNEKDYPLNIGIPVEFKSSCIKWHLDNSDIFYKPNGVLDKQSEKEIQAYLYSSMFNIPIQGVIIGFGSMPHVYHIKFLVKGFGSFSAFFEHGTEFEVEKLYAALNAS